MFRDAYEIAAEFTNPVVLSRRTFAGRCSASIGSFVIINDEEWIVTAHHLADQWKELSDGDKTSRAREDSEARIRADASLNKNERRRQLSQLGKPKKNDTIRAAAWWGSDGVAIKGRAFISVPAVDITIAQIEDFDPAWVRTYPKFKDPTKAFKCGQSLCKLGFPFHQIVPIWDDALQNFNFNVPIPRFPIDGILTRLVQVVLPSGVQSPFPLTWIETSSPGLRGQSGGPTFDPQGTIWGIQVRTAHFPLGFSQKGEPEQFLNVGLGVHTETLIGLFNDNGVKFELSAY